jgi:hypothetical protein
MHTGALQDLQRTLCLPPATAAVRPDVPQDHAGAPTTKASEWAKTALNFHPETKQAEVLDTAAKYLILCCNRQWGKTTTIAIKALHHALTTPDQTIVILSRTKHQAAILINRATVFTRRLDIRLRRVMGFPFSIQLPNGSNIIAVAHSGDTSVGNSANVLIVDEAALVQDAVYWTVSASVSRTHGKIWILSTPRRQAGFFYNIWHDQSPKWHRIFSDVNDCPAIDQDYLEMQKAADLIRYRQDFLCEFIQPADRLTDMETIRRMLRYDIDQWHFEPIFKDYIPAPK